MIELRYFARLREAIGHGAERADPPPGLRDLGELVDWLASRGPNYRTALSDRSRLRAAINQKLVDLDAPFAPGDEVAFFPPMTGG